MNIARRLQPVGEKRVGATPVAVLGLWSKSQHGGRLE